MVLYQWLQSLLHKEEGQGMAEYALILALIAVALIIALIAVQGGISGAFEGVVSGLGAS
jgi:pilus assembly protein Flp/PilA